MAFFCTTTSCIDLFFMWKYSKYICAGLRYMVDAFEILSQWELGPKWLMCYSDLWWKLEFEDCFFSSVKLFKEQKIEHFHNRQKSNERVQQTESKVSSCNSWQSARYVIPKRSKLKQCFNPQPAVFVWE